MLCLCTLLYTLAAAMVFVADGYALFCAQRFAFGFFVGGACTATGTIMACSVPPGQQGLGVSIFSLSTALGLALGPFFGIWLEEQYGFFVLNVDVTLLCAASFVLSLLLKNPPKQTIRHGAFFRLSNFIDMRVAKISLVALIVPLGYACLSAYIAMLCEERGMDTAAGMFFMISAGTTILSRPFAGRLFDVAGENSVIYPSIAAAGIALFLVAAADSPWLIALAGFVQGAGLGNFQSSGQALALKLSDREHFAQATSTFFICWDAALGAAPYVFGLAAAAWGFGGMFCLLGGIVLSALPVYYSLHGRSHPSKKRWWRPRPERGAN